MGNNTQKSGMIKHIWLVADWWEQCGRFRYLLNNYFNKVFSSLLCIMFCSKTIEEIVLKSKNVGKMLFVRLRLAKCEEVLKTGAWKRTEFALDRTLLNYINTTANRNKTLTEYYCWNMNLTYWVWVPSNTVVLLWKNREIRSALRTLLMS